MASQNQPYLLRMTQRLQQVEIFLSGNAEDKLDALVFEAETAITLLQERRSALISAAVTGKIDVRGLVAAKTEAA